VLSCLIAVCARVLHSTVYHSPCTALQGHRDAQRLTELMHGPQRSNTGSRQSSPSSSQGSQQQFPSSSAPAPPRRRQNVDLDKDEVDEEVGGDSAVAGQQHADLARGGDQDDADLAAILSALQGSSRGAPAAVAPAADPLSTVRQLTAEQRHVLAAALASAPPTPLVQRNERQRQMRAEATPGPPNPPPKTSASSYPPSPQHMALVEAAITPREKDDSVPAAAAVVPKAIFNLDVDIGGGRKGRIVVTKDADVGALAADFGTLHGLPAAVLPRLCDLIRGSIRQFTDNLKQPHDM
jgi:hypothetical protein